MDPATRVGRPSVTAALNLSLARSASEGGTPAREASAWSPEPWFVPLLNSWGPIILDKTFGKVNNEVLVWEVLDSNGSSFHFSTGAVASKEIDHGKPRTAI